MMCKLVKGIAHILLQHCSLYRDMRPNVVPVNGQAWSTELDHLMHQRDQVEETVAGLSLVLQI